MKFGICLQLFAFMFCLYLVCEHFW